MRTATLCCTIGVVAFALPQPPVTPPRLPTVNARPLRRQNQIIPVIVGGPQDTFVPNSVVAAVGDVLQFQFSNGNHTVTQSTADTACTPMEGGVHSGHIPFQDGQTEVGTFNMPVTSTEPMFLYCATGPHCQLGQVMVVNAVNAKQVADYAKKSQETASSTDGTDVIGGTPGTIALDIAAFTPAPPEDAAAAPPPPPPPAEAPPAEAPPAEAPPAEAPPAEAPPAEAPPAEAPPAEAPPAEAPPAEAPPAEAPPAEAPPAEAPPAEAPPAEAPPAETPPAEALPAEAPPAEAHPAEVMPPAETPAATEQIEVGMN
ncbi:hypothetical protein FB567DRAFT_322853 [Paraphoma chrysanthemicola]|uniref:Extracellular serine-rich protein n=1 Tax=Paraphoma chrysanthemicola TaxID=798071 RepID=A0A8K0RBB0_9PLEO|nr:hypothetical protein FB567DRAFT_322853 [Paraphoma chrysanthemicola]